MNLTPLSPFVPNPFVVRPRSRVSEPDPVVKTPSPASAAPCPSCNSSSNASPSCPSRSSASSCRSSIPCWHKRAAKSEAAAAAPIRVGSRRAAPVAASHGGRLLPWRPAQRAEPQPKTAHLTPRWLPSQDASGVPCQADYRNGGDPCAPRLRQRDRRHAARPTARTPKPAQGRGLREATDKTLA